MPPNDEKNMVEVRSSINAPRPLIANENAAKNWEEWIQQYKWYEIATNLKSKSKEVQAATFMSIIGLDGIRIYNTFGLSAKEQEDVEVIKTKFQEFFCTKNK